MKEIVVLSTSLNPKSNSRKLCIQAVAQLKELGANVRFIDLQDSQLPLCDGGSAYGHPEVGPLTSILREAGCILVGVPIYNYDVSAAAKNVVELTGDAWNDKLVGFLCAAGGKSSYMSVMSFANSLMLDFRCLVIPRFVYAERSSFDAEAVSDSEIINRIHALVKMAVQLSTSLHPAQPVS